MSSQKLKIIFITGHGRSGSTLLDMLLGTQTDIVSVGQINRLPDFVNKLGEAQCSCSSNLEKCIFWSRVFKDLSSSGFDYSNKFLDPYLQSGKRLSQLKPVLSRLIFDRSLNSSSEFDQKQNLLLESILIHSGSSIISDSSKNIMRLLALLNNEQVDIYVVFLVRNCKGVIASKLKHKSQRPANAWLSSLSWAYQNLLCLMVYKTLPRSKRLLVNFDDLVVNPGKEMLRIQQQFNLPLEFIQNLPSSVNPEFLHIFAGNKVSKAGNQRISAEFVNKSKLVNKLPELLIGKPIELILRKLKN